MIRANQFPISYSLQVFRSFPRFHSLTVVPATYLSPKQALLLNKQAALALSKGNFASNIGAKVSIFIFWAEMLKNGDFSI